MTGFYLQHIYVAGRSGMQFLVYIYVNGRERVTKGDKVTKLEIGVFLRTIQL